MSSYALRSAGIGTAERNRVLRNTYQLLALSLLPTAVGAWVGVSFGLGQLFTGWVGAILFLAVAYGFMFAIERSRNSALGVPLLLAFTFFMGVTLSGLLTYVLQLRNGVELIAMAFGSTSLIFLVMGGIASVTKKDLSGLGKGLTIAAVVLLGAAIANIFFQSGPLMLLISAAVTVVFSLFLLVELKEVRDGRQTNYISATLGIYLSLFNVFTSLLRLFAVFGGEE